MLQTFVNKHATIFNRVRFEIIKKKRQNLKLMNHTKITTQGSAKM